MDIYRISRRSFITKSAMGIASLGVLPSTVKANYQEDASRYDFLMGRVKFTANRGSSKFWATYPGSDKNLLREFSRICRCKVKLPPNCEDDSPLFGNENQFNGVVDLTDMKELRKYPFLFMTSEYDFKLSQLQKKNLTQFIKEGGFLLMDDCVVYGTGDFFYQSAVRLMRELFSADSVRAVPFEHEVFRNMYDFTAGGIPVIQGRRQPAIGVFVDERLAVLISANDLHCGWYGWTGKNSREYIESIKMGINIVMYAITH
ncbi:MAG: DUF4159 domain-containing protein [Anaerohalosphaera sp.]|nr:DUF4159 domain-containing protein [Anaerohalosphaera sp.]